MNDYPHGDLNPDKALPLGFFLAIIAVLTGIALAVIWYPS